MLRRVEHSNWAPVLSDKRLDRSLMEDGIVKVKLNEFNPEIATSFLQENVAEYPESFASSFYGSFLDSDIELKRKISGGLSQLIDPIVDPLFLNQRTLSYFFIVKGKGKDSEVNLHQDWSIVDERKYRGFTLWIPLIDSTAENGTLYAIKGSHNLPLNIRGGSIPSKYPASVSKELFSILSPYVVNIGEALIFDSRLLHYSPPNNSHSIRTSIITNIIPREAQTISFVQEEMDGNQEIFSYSVPFDFYIDYDDFLNEKNFPHRQGINKTKVDYANSELVSEKELMSLLNKHARPRKKWLFF